jgi:hypothetical protein
MSIATLLLFVYNTKNYASYLVICYLLTMPAIFFSNYKTGIVLCLSFLCYSIGGFVYNLFSKTDIAMLQKQSFRVSREKFKYAKRSLFSAAYMLGVVSILFSGLYFSVVGISLFAVDVGVARLENRDAIGGAFIYQRMFRVLFPTVVIFLYAVWVSKNRPSSFMVLKISSVILLIFFILNASFLGFTGIKANVITFLLIPLVIFHNLYIGRTSIIQLILIVVVAALLLLFMVNRMMPYASIVELAGFVFFRLGSGATDGLHYVIHTYEPKYGLQLGATFFQDFTSIFGKLGFGSFNDKTLGQLIAIDLLGDNYRGEQAAVTLSGELYVNFGFWGMAFVSLLVGGLLQNLYLLAFNFNISPLRMVFISYVQAAVLLIIGGPVVSMAFDYAVFICGFFIIWRVAISLPKIRGII